MGYNSTHTHNHTLIMQISEQRRQQRRQIQMYVFFNSSISRHAAHRNHSLQLTSFSTSFIPWNENEFGWWGKSQWTRLPLLNRISNLQINRDVDMATPPLKLRVKYPYLSPRENILLYLTHVTSSQVRPLSLSLWYMCCSIEGDSARGSLPVNR